MTNKLASSVLGAGFFIALATSSLCAAEVAPTLDSKGCDKPAYPRASLVNEEQGTVSLAFLIAVDGHVVESKIEKSSGFKNLDKAALTGLGQCKFKPGTKDGKAEQGWTKVDYAWKLD
jgi:protein TonB